MKRLGLLLAGLTISILTYGQIIKIQGGTTLSKLDWQIGSMDLEPYNETLVGYSVFVGLDYLDKKYFNLSSNLGLVRKGGKGELQLINPMGELTGETVIEKAASDYFSVNTLIDVKYQFKEKISPFISIGPRFDYLIGYSNHFDSLEEIDELKKTSLGVILGGGIKYDLSKIQLGLRADYYLNFTKVADWPAEPGNLGGEINDNMFSINLAIGYKLQ